ncbi:TolC family protein [Tunturiibacter gelidoferens]|jgi:outer membrane protein|uniref:Outer membrane protein TolC n=1 Tax=Tunturiibacter gelidiferens TaxID=3069689 RepID=A0A9X0QFJ5_9BACT|nr:TolC family protein [Edaphobacter lichenicola]MBB5329324.1 outer membrane protein TolC [Edaphobacter lichenicola]
MKRSFQINTIFAFSWMMAFVIAPSTAEAWQATTSGIAASDLSGSAQNAASPTGAAAAQVNGGAPARVGVQNASQAAPVITLDQALSMAKENEPAFAAAVAASKTAQLDRSIARAALLPSVVYHNQYLYTQPNGGLNQAGSTGTQAAPRFIANNTVHEYISQGVVTETIGLAQYSALARAGAAAAIASAEMEISRRGLTSTVIGLFYNSTAAQERIVIQEQATNEAADFVKQTEQREVAREVAHADVIKAQLTLQQRQRDLGDAQLQSQRARLDLGVLLFPDPRSPYSVTLPAATPLPERGVVETQAAANNPELKSAVATLRSKDLDITTARAAYLPDLVLNYSYGIDAPQFAVNGPDSVRNLGYSASATLDIPVWDWLATQHKIKQAHILRDAAKVSLTFAQRTLIAQLEEFYGEASLAHDQLASLELSVQTARESLRLTRMRYSAGEATVLEVVDAQNSFTTAELAHQDGTIRYQLALANLQLLTGTI